MENITIIINYKSFRHLILVIIINYYCRKIIIIIRYNQLLTPKLGCGCVETNCDKKLMVQRKNIDWERGFLHMSNDCKNCNRSTFLSRVGADFFGLLVRDFEHCFAIITWPNCALDGRIILFLYIPGFQRQVFKHIKILSERSKKIKEQKTNKGSVLVEESTITFKKAQFGFLMICFQD